MASHEGDHRASWDEGALEFAALSRVRLDRRSGLRNLEEGAAALGGAVRLEPNQPHRTVLELSAPLRVAPS